MGPFGAEAFRRWASAFIYHNLPAEQYEPLGFVSNDFVMATSLTPESEAPASPRRARVVLLDAATGRVLGAQEWSVFFAEIALHPVRDGKFVIRTAHKLILYSEKFEEIAEVSLPRRNQEEDWNWKVYVTPTRKSVVIEHWLDQDLEVQWMDTDSLKPKRSWLAPEGLFRLTPLGDPRRGRASIPRADWTILPVGTKRLQSSNYYADRRDGSRELRDVTLDRSLAFSDTALAATVTDRATHECKVSVLTAEESWRLIFHSPRCGQEAQFVNDDTLYLSAEDEMLVLRTDGRILSRQQLGRKEFSLAARPSTNGLRFAVPVDTLKGGSEMLDISPHDVLKRIMIYDIPTRRWVFALDGKLIDFERLAGFAISPDGLRVALLRENAVEVYRLPDYEKPVTAPE